MKVSQKNRIQDLISQIEEVDKMMVFNMDNPSKLMADQYEYLKKRYLSELMQELMSINDLSNKYSFELIQLVINKYYPEVGGDIEKKNGLKKEKIPVDLKEIKALIIAA